jgi:hypothetical protein
MNSLLFKETSMSTVANRERVLFIPPQPWKADVARPVIQELNRSNLSVGKFAALHGIPAHRLKYWQSKLSDTVLDNARNEHFVPVKVASQNNPRNDGNIRLIEVMIADGLVVRFREDIHPETFAQFVDACRAQRC